MTNTSSPGAADAAPPMAPPATYAHDTADPRMVFIDTSAFVPQLTALVRWLLQGLGIWLVARGMAQARVDGLMAILPGLVMSGAALAWSCWQKRLASARLKTAALADPARVVLK